MQRTLTILVFILLLVIGAVVLTGGATGQASTYGVPSDPVLAAVLVGSIIALLVLTVVLGIALARGVGIVSSQLGEKLSPDDRPVLEKRALEAVDKAGNALGSALGKVGYGESAKVAPYTPNYSYKAEPENQETRGFLIWFGIPMALLAVYAIVTQGPKWLDQLAGMDKTLLAIGIGSIIVIAGAIGVVGAGLSFWFFRTTEEEAKAATLKGPQWPSTELVALEQRVRNAPKSIMEMTFLDRALIGLNVGLLLIMLIGIAVWVVPGMATVAATDLALNPKPTAVPGADTGGGAPVSAVPPDLAKEIAALPKGDAANGKTVFTTQACHTCHVDTPVGPAMPGDPPIGDRAATRKPGYDATAYIYESITQPSAYVVSGFNDGLMPKNFKQILKPQEIADLIAYLETLK